MKTTVSWNTRLVKRVLLHHFALIIIIPIILAVSTVVISQYFGGNKYTATSELVQKDNQVGQISAYQNYIQTNKFKDSLKDKIRNSQWKGTETAENYSIAITTTTNSPFFNITGVSDNPYFSRYVANATTSVFQSQIGGVIVSANISLLTSANLNTKPVQVNYQKKIIVALGIGLIISLFLAFLKEIKFGKVVGDDYLEDVHGIKNLGTLEISKHSRGQNNVNND